MYLIHIWNLDRYYLSDLNETGSKSNEGVLLTPPNWSFMSSTLVLHTGHLFLSVNNTFCVF